MTIKINGKKIDYTLEHEQTIGEVLGSIEQACAKELETVVSVDVDGRELEAAELDSLFARSVSSNVCIGLKTLSGGDIRVYMAELLTTLQTIADEFEQISVYMQTGSEDKVLALLEQFSLKLNELYHCLLLSDITGISPSVMVQEKPLQYYQKEINTFLQEIISGIEENDIIQVGDIAEYELCPLIKIFINGIKTNLN